MTDQRIIVRPLYVVDRQSTDILAIEDREIAGAVRFIRQHAKEPLQVGNVAEAVALSRRTLQRRFHMALRRSVRDEIRRVRTEQIALMVTEMEVSLSQIALACGFPGVEQMDRYFRREKGVSPSAYRKR